MHKMFGKIVKELRTENRLLQKELAAELGVGRTTVVSWETGQYEPDLETLEKIADYFGVTTDYLLGR